jgi:hypothetical protein
VHTQTTFAHFSRPTPTEAILPVAVRGRVQGPTPWSALFGPLVEKVWSAGLELDDVVGNDRVAIAVVVWWTLISEVTMCGRQVAAHGRLPPRRSVDEPCPYAWTVSRQSSPPTAV